MILTFVTKSLFEAHMVSICVIAVLPGPLAAGEPLPDVSLIHAKVISVGEKDSKGVVSATLEITRVYLGVDDLRGRTFRDVQAAGWTSGDYALVPFQVGEQGIWVLKKKKNEYMPTSVNSFPFGIRCRKIESGRYTDMVAFAEAFEKVDRTISKDRGAVLRKLVVEENSLICGWAVRKIGESASTSDQQFLDEIAKAPGSKLPVAAQIAFDEVYSKTKKEDWLATQNRAQLLRSWVGGKLDEDQARSVLARLSKAEQAEELSNKAAVELIQSAAENKGWPWHARKAAIYGVGQVASREVDDNAGFAWLFEHVRTHSESRVRLAAAEAIWAHVPLYPKRLKAVEEHLATEADEAVAAALRGAVKKAKESDKK